jgi:LysM repeat protein
LTSKGDLSVLISNNPLKFSLYDNGELISCKKIENGNFETFKGDEFIFLGDAVNELDISNSEFLSDDLKKYSKIISEKLEFKEKDDLLLQGKLLDNVIDSVSFEYDVPKEVLFAIVAHESGFLNNPLNGDGDGGAGIGHFSPGMARYYHASVFGDSDTTDRDLIYGNKLTKEVVSLFNQYKNTNYNEMNANEFNQMFRKELSVEEKLKFWNKLCNEVDERFCVKKGITNIAKYLNEEKEKLSSQGYHDYDTVILAFNRGRSNAKKPDDPHNYVDKIKELTDLYGKEISQGNLDYYDDYLEMQKQMQNRETYVVQGGDSFSKLSAQFEIDKEILKRINNKNSDFLREGETLLVEVGDYIIVQEGDSIWSLSQLFGIKPDKLKELNNLEDDTIHVGQTIKIK